MTKRIFALLLCVVMLSMSLVSCGHDRKIDGENYFGAEITLYLSDMVYDFDPAYAYANESTLKIVSLLFDTLFTVNEEGEIKGSLAESYEIIKDEKSKEYKMQITLRKDQGWSDGTAMSADDIVYSWKRIMDPAFSSTACALLYDIKNAKEVKSGDVSIDSLGIYAVDSHVLEITFVDDIDYDAFLMNLTSVMLAPLRETTVDSTPDWSKKVATTCCSGPFMLRRMDYGLDDSGNLVGEPEMILERNQHFRRDPDEDYLDKTIKPYRLIVDFSKTEEEQLAAYEAGEIFYVGDIALSKRNDYKDQAKITDALSTHTYFLNENADIAKKGGETEKLFANKNVRLALSSVIDRQAIADAVVFAKAATALVPYGIFNENNAKSIFRKVGGDLLSSSADTAKAQEYITASGITPSDYTFKVSVDATDDINCMIAETVVAAWKELGFNVEIDLVNPKINQDKYYGEYVKTIYDSKFNEIYESGEYEVLAVDLVAPTASAFSVLAPFAKAYSGQAYPGSIRDYVEQPHKTGYYNEAYDKLIADAQAAATAAEKAELLHQAEKLLMEDMPVIPIIFHQNATLCAKDLSKVTYSYYGLPVFNGAKLKNWEDYIIVDTAEETKPVAAPDEDEPEGDEGNDAPAA